MAALGTFRSSVFFVFAVAAFADRDQRGLIPASVFLLDVATWHLSVVVGVTGNMVYNETWFNTLANRFIFEKVLERFRNREEIEFQSIIREGTVAAKDDIELFLREKTAWSGWGTIKKTAAGIALFVWHWVSYGLFYGVAALLGNFLRNPY
ncbi:hypothetical protein [Bradyrhizobium elkanii]|uniref:hypothetical protein n=1 Tax=Bradyrhizobium elkanii TaxID=29448 RepID=UPI0027151F34|nr:hypothetical protein [Bradyrhizobium elkanii]WLA50731.1 hypothetical protein QIH80_11450 [Bradyrhizobium elkanii]WLB79031.1 hypothetical protein QIH83_32565 [Bradyrhizobium elkanii]